MVDQRPLQQVKRAENAEIAECEKAKDAQHKRYAGSMRGRVPQYSGCSTVLVYGEMTPNFSRHPSGSTIPLRFSLVSYDGRWPG
jgi:hypothetical protein